MHQWTSEIPVVCPLRKGWVGVAAFAKLSGHANATHLRIIRLQTFDGEMPQPIASGAHGVCFISLRRMRAIVSTMQENSDASYQFAGRTAGNPERNGVSPRNRQAS
jgi:hypothetical protein